MRLPPLNALRAFEAAGRFQNLSRAAEELHVTQGAVSRQVKLLEERLGVPLFRRRPQGLELTAAGGRLLPELSAAFERIARAVSHVQDDNHEVRVISAATIGIRWLTPHLPRFQEQYPGLRVSIGLFRRSWDEFFDGGFDLAIACSSEAPPPALGLKADLIRRELLTPVCSPSLPLTHAPLQKPADLRRHVLLHPYSDRNDWRLWLGAAGIDDVDIGGGQTFDTMEMAIQAAVGGLGVAMADLCLYQVEVDAGQLLAPFDLTVSDGTGYYLCYRHDSLDHAKITAFRDWLLKEAAAETEDARGRPVAGP